MRPRIGAAIAASVLRPLAEQLVAELDLTRSSVACDLMCDSGVLTRALAHTIGPFGRVIAVDTDLDLATEAAEGLLGFTIVVPRMGDGATVPLDDDSCDAVASLTTIAFADQRFLVADIPRVLRRDGRGAVLVWDESEPPAFASLLRDALTEAGLTSAFLDRMLAPVGVPRGAHVRGIRDVCRADTASLLWAAMLDSPLAVELAAVPDATVAVVRSRYEALLAPFAEADGTLRIPLHARLITLAAAAPRPGY